MSLFSLKSIWRYSPPSIEEFDRRHLAIGVIDQSFEDRVCLASYSGVLRIFKIGRGFKQTDLLFEQKYDEPIVAIKIQQTNNRSYFDMDKSIQILFLKKLIVVSFNYSSQILEISKSRQLNFKSPCFTFFTYPLVSVSLNSQLHYLNPPSTISIKQSQPIYACDLSSISENFYYADGEQLVMTKVGIQQLRVLVGQITDIHIYGEEHGQPKVLCVGEKQYWILTGDGGTIIQAKRIQGQISASFIVETSNGFNIVLTTFSKLLLIYDEGKLLWGAKTQFIPISIKTITIQGKPGILCLLSQAGSIQICYLGAQPSIESIQPLVPNIDMKRIQQQIINLQNEIKNKSNNEVVEQRIVNLLNLSCTGVKIQWTDKYVQQDQKLFQINGKKRVLLLKIKLVPQNTTLFDVKIQLKLPTNMYTQNVCLTLEQLNKSFEQQFQIYLQLNRFPYSDSIEVNACYFSSSLKKQLVSTSIQISIPFSFQAIKSTSKAQKQKSSHNIVLFSNNTIPRFNELFKDVEAINEDNTNQNQISFLISSNIYTTILASKHTSKYKISSTFYEGLWVIILEFIKRLQKIGIELTVESVPLEELFVISQSHFKLQNKLSTLKISLEQSSQELKLVQKRILTKIKEKDCDLNVIEELLVICQKNTIKLCNDYQQSQQQLQAVSHQLMISVLTICQLLFLRGKVSTQGRQTIFGILRVQQNTKYSQDWTWQHQILVNSSILQNKKVNKSQLQGIQFQRIKKVLIWLVDKTAKGQIK